MKELKMKSKRKERIMKGFITLVLCICFVGFSETSKAVEQEYRLGDLEREYRQSCDGGDLSGCYHLGDLERARGNIREAAILYTKICDGGDLSGCNRLENLGRERDNIKETEVLFIESCEEGIFLTQCTHLDLCEVGVFLTQCTYLGALKYEKGNIDKALGFVIRACDRGDLECGDHLRFR